MLPSFSIIAILGILLRVMPFDSGKIMLALICIGLSILLGLIAPQELSTSGFAARVREPDYLAYYLAWSACLLALLNLVVIYRTTNPRRLHVAYAITAALVLISFYAYFALW